MVHHDNAPAYAATKVQQFFAGNNTAIVQHPPYSPDLAICDFSIFPRLTMKLKGRRFDTIDEIQQETKMVLMSFQQRDFETTFEQWSKRWDRCINANGDYFEGDHDM